MKTGTVRFTHFLVISLIIHAILLLFVTLRLPQRHFKRDEPIVLERLPEQRLPAAERFADETHRTDKELRLLRDASSPSGVMNRDLAYITPPHRIEETNKQLPENKYEKGTTKTKPYDIKQLLPSHELINKLARDFNPGTNADAEPSKIISLNTTELKYVSYVTKIKRQIDLTFIYPVIAIQRGEQGSLVLTFTVIATGQLKDIKIVKSSGSKILDNAAVDAVTRASPYPPFPEEWHEKEITISALFEYILGYTVVQ